MATNGGPTIGVVVHPRRPIDTPIDAARSWAEERGGRLVQIAIDGQERRVADLADAEECDLILAVGGDGTVLAALHVGERAGLSVLGIACGSLGALTSVKAADVGAALDRYASGEWEPRALPALDITRDGERLGTAFNDLVLVRRSAGQVILDIDVNGTTYARTAGDGVVVATPQGSSAYTLAAGGPLIAHTTDALVITPLAPHGGSVPPVVLPGEGTVTIGVDSGWSGARIEIDGRVVASEEPEGEQSAFELQATLCPGAVTLLDFDGETLVDGLRRRGVIADSPRLRMRDNRASAAKRS
jgi:NAD+ kinase